MLQTYVMNSLPIENRLMLKYICDISKALLSIHNSNMINGAVKPSNIYLSDDNTALLGAFKKVELDSARQTNQLFSKLLIGEAIPSILIYWAPEVLKGEPYNTQADMWSLGVTIYQIATSEHPFRTDKETAFRDDVLLARVDYSRLEAFPRVKTVVENLLKVNPDKRWTAEQVLAFCQYDFAIDIQKLWRGYEARKDYDRRRRALVKIQSYIKGWLTRINYQRDRIICRENAAIMVQKKYRAYSNSKAYKKARRAIMTCQANVLARQGRRAFRKMKLDVFTCQAYIRRYLAFTWFKKMKTTRQELENNIDNIKQMIDKYNLDAKIFKDQFVNKKISGPLQYLGSFEQYEMTWAQTYGAEKSNLPQLNKIQQDFDKLQQKNSTLKKVIEEKKSNTSMNQNVNMMDDEETLKKELGAKYNDFKPMVEQVKKNLKRVAQLVKISSPLDIKIQHQYTYSKWDQIHEPYNIVENVLKDDESVYRALTPNLDFTLNFGANCFISEVYVYPGDCGPDQIQIFTSNIIDKWNLISEFKCNRDPEQSFLLPGEQISKYLRVACLNNIRGGNIVSVRKITIRGVQQDKLSKQKK